MAKLPRAKAHSSNPCPHEEPHRIRRYARIGEAAEYIGVADRTVRQMIADGRLTGYRSGGKIVRVDLNELDDAMVPFGGGAA